MTSRDRHIHHARALLAQARVFRLRRSPFAFTLIEWAGNARMLASQPAGQLDLFRPDGLEHYR